jgi:CHRD domain
MKGFVKLLILASAMLGIASICNAATFTATLSGANESPATVSPGTGNTTVTLNTTTHTLQVAVVFSGLTAVTTASHIHCCVAPGGNAGVATMVPSFTGFPLGVTSGTFSATFDTTLGSTWNPAYVTANGGTPLSAEAALAAGMAAGQAYLNIHTTAFPGGEIRGFLSAQAPTVIPTLTRMTMGILAALVAMIAFALTRKRAV